MLKVKLGNRYRDKIHGFEGVATMRTEYLTGCARICLEVLVGMEIKSASFDETQLEGVSVRQVSGGPGDHVSRSEPK